MVEVTVKAKITEETQGAFLLQQEEKDVWIAKGDCEIQQYLFGKLVDVHMDQETAEQKGLIYD
jgi:hypothetical protein